MSTVKMCGKLEPSLPSPRQRLLHIDDDERYCNLVSEYLGRHGYPVVQAHDGQTGYEKIMSEDWGMVLLDIVLPDVDGIKLLQKIRATSKIPVLMLTARGDEAQRVDGLELGADDYLPKVFSLRELLARIETVLHRSRERRLRPKGLDAISIGRLHIYSGSQRAFLDDTEIFLTEVEFAILTFLARNAGTPKTRDELIAGVIKRDDVGLRMVDVHVFALRKKLAKGCNGQRYIRTVRNVGYMLLDPEIKSE